MQTTPRLLLILIPFLFICSKIYKQPILIYKTRLHCECTTLYNVQCQLTIGDCNGNNLGNEVFFLSTHKCSCFDGQRIGGKVSHERTQKNIYTADPNRELFDTKTKKTNKHHSSYEFLTVSILNYIICEPFHEGFFGGGEGSVGSESAS